MWDPRRLNVSPKKQRRTNIWGPARSVSLLYHHGLPIGVLRGWKKWGSPQPQNWLAPCQALSKGILGMWLPKNKFKKIHLAAATSTISHVCWKGEGASVIIVTSILIFMTLLLDIPGPELFLMAIQLSLQIVCPASTSSVVCLKSSGSIKCRMQPNLPGVI